MAKKQAEVMAHPIVKKEPAALVALGDDAIIAYLREQDRSMADPEKKLNLRELLRAGMPVDRAAVMLKMKPATAWRIVASDTDIADALHEGEKARAFRVRHTVASRAHDMLNSLSDIAQDPDQHGKTRIDAIKMWLDMTGMLAGPTSSAAAAAVVEVDTVGSDFADRLQKITIKAGTINKG